MMELPPLANLMPAGFEGNPTALSPDFSSGGFNSLLLNQMINAEEEHCNGDGCHGKFLFPLSEESFLPRSNEEESLPSDTFDPLFALPLIHPLSVPVLPEVQELPASLHQASETPLFKSSQIHSPNAVGADIQGESSLFLKELGGVREELFISQNSERESVGHPPFQSGSGKMVLDLSLLEKGVSETVQRLVNRMGGPHEEPPSILQMKGKDAGNSLVTGKMEDDGQRGLTSLNPANASLEKGGPDLTLKFKFFGEPQIGGQSPGTENDDHGLVSLKNHPSLSEPYSIQNGVGPESKTEHFVPEAVPKGQNGFSPKVESFEIYQQVGRKIAWSVQNGEEKVKLILDPPRLGNLYMEVTKEREMVRVALLAESPVTKELLDAHRVELHRVLEKDGFKLERFDVFVQQEPGQSPERREFSFLRGQREGREIEEDRAFLSSESPDVPSIAVRRYPGVSSYIDRII